MKSKVTKTMDYSQPSLEPMEDNTGDGERNLEREEENEEPQCSKSPSLKAQKKGKKPSLKEICDECGNMVVDLKSHKYRYHPSNPSKLLQCPHCPFKTVMLTRFNNHYYECRKSFATSEASTNSNPDGSSSSSKTTPEEFTCQICRQRLPSKESYDVHYINAHKRGQRRINLNNFWKCDQCPKRFKYKPTLASHIKITHQGKVFFCELCPSLGCFPLETKLWHHKVDIHKMTDLEPPNGLTIIQCEFCGEKMFKGLEAHVKRRHPEEFTGVTDQEVQGAPPVAPSPASPRVRTYDKTKRNCPVCMKELHPCTIPKHLRNKHGIKDISTVKLLTFPCSQCLIIFKNKTQLTHHKCAHTTPPSHLHNPDNQESNGEKYVTGVNPPGPTPDSLRNKKVKCSQCSKEMHPCSLKIHLASIHGIGNLEKFSCSLCGREFNKKSFLVSHMKYVHDPVKESLSKSSIIKQVKLRKGTKMVQQCTFCFEMFKTRPLAIVHLVTEHPDEYSSVEKGIVPKAVYKCARCSEKFEDDEQLRSHVESIHPDKCWKCPKCWKVMLSSEEFSEHYKSDHMSESDGTLELEKGKVGSSDESGSGSSSSSDEQEEEFSPTPATRKSSRVPKRRKIESSFDTSSNSSSEDEVEIRVVVKTRKSNRGRKPCQVNRVTGRDCASLRAKLSDMKPCCIRLVRLTSEEIQQYLCPLGVVKEEEDTD